MSDKIYDILSYATKYILPAVGVLYLAVSEIWGLPYGSEVSATIIAVEAFLAVVLGLSTVIYNKEEE